MTLVTNVNKIPEGIPPYTWQPGQTIDVPVHVAQHAHRLPQFDVAWGEELKDKTNGKLNYLSVLTYMNPNEGYGLLGITSLRQLQKHLHVSIHMPPQDRVMAMLREAAPDIAELVLRPDKYPTRVGLHFGYPMDLKYMPTPVRVLSTMYETTRIPEEWDEHIRKADALILPSAGQAQIFRDSGCTQPISIVPSCFDMASWPYAERPPRETYTFMAWSRMSSRKMPFETIQCFQAAFPNEPDVRLIMKTRNGDFGAGRHGGIPEVRDSRITVIDAEWPQHQLYAAAVEADCGVFLSHGEGFYQGPVQAMATGLPTIAPNHSGCSAWADPKYCYVVGLDRENPYVEASGMGSRGGKSLEWWNPSLQETIAHMRYVYEHRDAARRKGKQASRWVHTKFSEEAMGRDLLKALNAV